MDRSALSRSSLQAPVRLDRAAGGLGGSGLPSRHFRLVGDFGPGSFGRERTSKQKRKGVKLSLKSSKHKSASAEGEASGSKSDKKKGACKKTLKRDNKEKELGIGSSEDDATGVEESLLRKNSILHSLKWDRIILDEVTSIYSIRTPFILSCFSLGTLQVELYVSS
ncbi:hypothetical protein LOK49_LG10G01318 [Camellia lanceoleosa]|uniref:Uncharacterized protein n=1 Tax=Camellia lanceoleosa TaxID=1840588 RepID=A0ACC0GAL0_9ERIC|nr:hypothetical protein LOK49_LG10G01318 [Camellia lanceoleosa]